MPSSFMHPQLPLVRLLYGARGTLRSGIPAFVLALACRSPQTATDGEAASAVTASTNDVAPSTTIVSESSQTSGSAVAASPITRSLECMGGERRLTYTRGAETTDALEVKLEFSAAGHRTWSYRFHYRDGVLQQIVHRVASWHFSGDSSGEPTTRDTVLERRYRLTGGEEAECAAARVSGPGATIESQLSKATATTIACSDVERLQALASRLNLATRVLDQPLLETACAHDDPSSGMKL